MLVGLQRWAVLPGLLDLVSVLGPRGTPILI